MGKGALCRAAVVCFWVSLFFETNICYGSNVIVEVIGSGECTDCLKSNIKTTHAYKGLKVTIECKSKDGDGFERRGSGELDEEGNFRVFLPNEGASGGRLDEDCFAQLHSASATPCPAVDGSESSKLVLMAETDGKQSFVAKKKLKFSPATCSSAFLWPFFKPPFLPKWRKQPFLSHPLLKNLGHPFPFPPKIFPKKPLPPLSFFKNPKLLPPIPLFKKPLPPLIPVYKKPPLNKLFPPQIPIFKKPLPPLIPIYKPKPPIFKPPTIFKKPLPPPIPVYKKPLPQIQKPPLKKLFPPHIPIFKKPLPPFIPIYKPKPPIFIPPIIFKKPLPPPIPVYKKPLPQFQKPPLKKLFPPHIPIFKKPLPPFIPIYKPKPPIFKPPIILPPQLPLFKKPHLPFIPIYKPKPPFSKPVHTWPKIPPFYKKPQPYIPEVPNFHHKFGKFPPVPPFAPHFP